LTNRHRDLPGMQASHVAILGAGIVGPLDSPYGNIFCQPTRKSKRLKR